MKIVIFSDSHGDTETMCGVVEKEKPDMIIHLGDVLVDAEQLNGKYPDIQMITALGSLDSKKEDEEWIKIAEICGKRFIITHGHTLIKYTFFSDTNIYQQTDEDRVTNQANILQCISENNADVFLHGHTHEPYINRVLMPEKVCWIMNPGSIRRMDDAIIKPTYGILEINESSALSWQFVEVE